MKTDHKQIETLAENLLTAIGEDVEREGLADTPKRYAKFLKEFLEKDEFNITTFENEGSGMIIQQDIPFYSLCEHHMVPFFGKGTIATYQTDK